jgi:hypothetical protein
MIRFSKRIAKKEKLHCMDILEEIIQTKEKILAFFSNPEIERISELIELSLKYCTLFYHHYDLIDKHHTKIHFNNERDQFTDIIYYGKHIYNKFLTVQYSDATDKKIAKFKQMYQNVLIKYYRLKRGIRSSKYGETRCPICFEDFTNKNILITNCNHAICNSCIIKCDKCCVCRKSFE